MPVVDCRGTRAVIALVVWQGELSTNEASVIHAEITGDSRSSIKGVARSALVCMLVGACLGRFFSCRAMDCHIDDSTGSTYFGRWLLGPLVGIVSGLVLGGAAWAMINKMPYPTGTFPLNGTSTEAYSQLQFKAYREFKKHAAKSILKVPTSEVPSMQQNSIRPGADFLSVRHWHLDDQDNDKFISEGSSAGVVYCQHWLSFEEEEEKDQWCCW